MADDGYSSSAWETTDNSDANSPGFAMYAPHLATDSEQDLPAPRPYARASSPPPRSSVESSSRPSTSAWHDSAPSVERREALSTISGDASTLVETTFDESILRALCDLDVSLWRDLAC